MQGILSYSLPKLSQSLVIHPTFMYCFLITQFVLSKNLWVREHSLLMVNLPKATPLKKTDSFTEAIKYQYIL